MAATKIANYWLRSHVFGTPSRFGMHFPAVKRPLSAGTEETASDPPLLYRLPRKEVLNNLIDPLPMRDRRHMTRLSDFC